jgi:hypothetical protein
VTRPLRISFAITILTAFTLVFVLALGAVVLGYRQTGASAALAAASSCAGVACREGILPGLLRLSSLAMNSASEGMASPSKRARASPLK